MQHISYKEALQKIRLRYPDFTEDEMDYLARQNPRSIRLCDFPNTIKKYIGLPREVLTNNLDPKYCFFNQEFIDTYENQCNRFVYGHQIRNLRNWCSGDFPSISSILEKAAQKILLRWYDKTNKDFSFLKKFKVGDKESEVLWINTEEGKLYVNNIESFYLLEDIVSIERVFFNRKREDCLRELGLENE